jgi:hypothetical protein
MSIYTKQSGLAAGFHDAIVLGIQAITEPAHGLLRQLLHGDSKALIIAWGGPLEGCAFHQDADPIRGDGRVKLVRPGDPLFQMPTNIASKRLNIRVGVPLWILGWQGDRPITLAMGLFYPLLSSASLDVFCQETGHYLSRFYFIDKRDAPAEQLDEDYMEWKTHCESRELEEWGVQLSADCPSWAPHWPALTSWSTYKDIRPRGE